MDELKNWTFSLCCGAAAGALLSLLAPNSSLGKVCRFAVRVFFLCCAILPLRQIGQVFRIIPDVQAEASYSAQEIFDVITDQVGSSAASAIEQEAAQCLEKAGINFKKVKADVHVDQDGGISINCIRVLLPPDTGEDLLGQSSIAELLEARLGIDVELAVENGGESP